MNALGLMTHLSGASTNNPAVAAAALNPFRPSTYHALDDTTTQGIQNPLMGGKMAEKIVRVQEPTRVLVVRNIATVVDTKEDSAFSDLYSDVMDKCSLYGKVLEIRIPRAVLNNERMELNKRLDLERMEEEKVETVEA